MKNDIKQLPFEELFAHYTSVLASAKESLVEDSAESYQESWEKRHRNLIQVAMANDTDEDACDDKWDAYYRDAYPFNPKDVVLPQKVLDNLKADAIKTACEYFSDKHALGSKIDWLPYQMFAFFGAWTPIKVGELYCAKATLMHNVKNDYDKGIAMLAISDRSNFFAKALKTVRQYNSVVNPLVPIVLAGFKQHQDIPYNAWNRETIGSLVHKALAESMLSEVPELSKSERLEMRHNAITDITGKRAGIMNNPSTCVKLNKINETAVAHLPKLAKHWVIQTWCAHPTNRTVLSVLDAKDWDAVPEPLISTDMLATPAAHKVITTTTKSDYIDTPW